MTEHVVKIHDRYYDAVANGIKTFEIRKADRDYRVGDTLVLQRCNDKGNVVYHGDDNLGINVPDQIYCAIAYILTSEDFPDGIKEGYCVLGIKRTAED